MPHDAQLPQHLEKMAPLLSRRGMVLSVVGLTVAGCARQVVGPAVAGGLSGSCPAVPEETEGPYPADGSGGRDAARPNILKRSGVVRRDIRSSLAGGGMAEGVPLTLTLQLVDTDNGCSPLAGHVLYVWHCDAQGRYSLYDVPGESWLRGVQVADDAGRVTFETIFPGAYAGRYPHIHFEIYPDLASAPAYDGKIRTSQLALPEPACEAVYADRTASPGSAANLARSPLTTDNVFADNTATELSAQTPELSGSVEAGFQGHAVIGYSRSARIPARPPHGPGGPPPGGPGVPGRPPPPRFLGAG